MVGAEPSGESVRCLLELELAAFANASDRRRRRTSEARRRNRSAIFREWEDLQDHSSHCTPARGADSSSTAPCVVFINRRGSGIFDAKSYIALCSSKSQPS